MQSPDSKTHKKHVIFITPQLETHLNFISYKNTIHNI